MGFRGLLGLAAIVGLVLIVVGAIPSINLVLRGNEHKAASNTPGSRETVVRPAMLGFACGGSHLWSLQLDLQFHKQWGRAGLF